MLQNWQLDGFPYFWTFSSHFLQILEVLLLLKYFDWKIIISSKNFFILWFINEWVNMSKLTFLVEIRIYSTYIWQQEMILYTPYIIAVLVIVLRTGDDWNICCKQTRPLLEVAHDLLLKPPSSLQFLTHLSVAGRRKRNIRTKSWKILEMEIVHRNIWYHTWYRVMDYLKWHLFLKIFRTFEYLVC